MKNPVTILAILGDASQYGGVVDWIRRRGLVVTIVTTAEDGLRVHRESGADLVLVGLPLPDHRASSLIGELRHQDPRAPIVVVGVDTDVGSQLQALELGAQDYVADPVEGRKDVLFALGVSLGMRNGDAHLRVLRDRDAATAEWRAIVANCRPMLEVMTRLRHICARPASSAAAAVLLSGELGTGKRLFARALHYNGARRNRAYAEINCAAAPATVLQSQLFGYERGAFQDARAMRQGLFETVEGGTVFLDEIGAIPLDLQADLLVAIEDKQIRRVAGSQMIQIDVQIVGATRRDLAAMVKANLFRSDLYHRLNVVSLQLPPLRDRGDDVDTIAKAMIDQIASEQGIPAPVLSHDAVEALRRHRWPGNARELRNEIERIVLMVDDQVIRADHFRNAATTSIVSIDGNTVDLQVLVTGETCPLDRVEAEVIRQALLKCGNVSRTARYLAITRQTLLYRMKKYGFVSPSNPGFAPEDKEPS